MGRGDPASSPGEQQGKGGEAEGEEEEEDVEEEEEGAARAAFFRDRRPSAVYFTPDKAEGFPWLTWSSLIHVSLCVRESVCT